MMLTTVQYRLPSSLDSAYGQTNDNVAFTHAAGVDRLEVLCNFYKSRVINAELNTRCLYILSVDQWRR
jgi:hypothetical protein